MKIALCHSMNFAEKAEDVRRWFDSQGQQAFPSTFNHEYLGLDENAKETLKLKHKYGDDAIREHWFVIQRCDATLVLNFEKNGIPGYVGGNSFLEMGFAYIQNKPIYLLNPIPKISFYESEMIAMKPQVINGNLSLVLASSISAGHEELNAERSLS